MDIIETIEWHDLPIKSLAINEDMIRIEVLQFNETLQDYDKYVLALFEFESIELLLNGKLANKTLDELEIAGFEYTIEDNLLSGKIGILPGNTGYWEIKVEKSNWTLHEGT